MKTWIVANPEAGAAEEMRVLEDRLRRRKGVRIERTSCAGHAAELARRALDEGWDRIVAAGGDGTLNEVVNGLGDRVEDAVVGLLPLGTGNDFARSVGVPAGPAAVDVLERGEVDRLDLLVVRKGDSRRWVVNAVSGGFSSLVAEKHTDAAKRRLGALAFVVSAGKALPELTRYSLRLELDDDDLRLDAYNFVAANGAFIGGGIEVAPEASLDDGLLDLAVIPALPLGELALELPAVVHGESAGSLNSVLVRRRVRRLRVESEPAVTVSEDGELRDETPLEVEVEPRRLRFLTRPGSRLAGASKDR